MAETGTITAYRWFVEPCGTQREQKTPKEGAVWVDWVDHVIISLGIFASWKFQDKLTYLRFGMTGSAHCSSYTILYSYILKLFQGSFQWAGFGNAPPLSASNRKWRITQCVPAKTCDNFLATICKSGCPPTHYDSSNCVMIPFWSHSTSWSPVSAACLSHLTFHCESPPKPPHCFEPKAPTT